MLAQEQFDQLTARMLTDRGLCARILGALETHDQAYVRAMYQIYTAEPSARCIGDALESKPVVSAKDWYGK